MASAKVEMVQLSIQGREKPLPGLVIAKTCILKKYLDALFHFAVPKETVQANYTSKGERWFG